jgi:hypothetical protein
MQMHIRKSSKSPEMEDEMAGKAKLAKETKELFAGSNKTPESESVPSIQSRCHQLGANQHIRSLECLATWDSLEAIDDPLPVNVATWDSLEAIDEVGPVLAVVTPDNRWNETDHFAGQTSSSTSLVTVPAGAVDSQSASRAGHCLRDERHLVNHTVQSIATWDALEAFDLPDEFMMEPIKVSFPHSMQPMRVSSGVQEFSMKDCLESIRAFDEASIMLVRQIHKLGVNASDVLRSHFSQYGEVRDVIIPLSCAKVRPSTGRKKKNPVTQRRRIGGLGFVIMACVEDAQKMLCGNSVHNVGTIIIQLQHFHHNNLVSNVVENDVEYSL